MQSSYYSSVLQAKNWIFESRTAIHRLSSQNLNCFTTIQNFEPFWTSFEPIIFESKANYKFKKKRFQRKKNFLDHGNFWRETGFSDCSMTVLWRFNVATVSINPRLSHATSWVSSGLSDRKFLPFWSKFNHVRHIKNLTRSIIRRFKWSKNSKNFTIFLKFRLKLFFFSE